MLMKDSLPTTKELLDLEKVISDWTEGLVKSDSPVVSVERGDPTKHEYSGNHSYEQGWYIRLIGESKEFFSLWMELGQRTLQYESYFMPAPIVDAEKLYKYLLEKNSQSYGASFSIGTENAIFIVGRLSISQINQKELDRILGTVYSNTEAHFKPAMRIGYKDKFKG